jgi:hypothetical protein
MCQSGSLFTHAPFACIPEPLQKVKNIAFSGDGEPTTCPQFKEAVELAIAAKQKAGLPDLKIIVITNATMFHRATVSQALSIPDKYNGEIWAKLDAGTELYYKQVDVTTISFKRILDNILDAARMRADRDPDHQLSKVACKHLTSQQNPEHNLNLHVDRQHRPGCSWLTTG